METKLVCLLEQQQQPMQQQQLQLDILQKSLQLLTDKIDAQDVLPQQLQSPRVSDAAFPCHTLNGQTHLEFSRFQEMEGEGAGPELRVKAAALWVRVAFRPSLPKDLRSIPDKNLTLWLFKVTKPATVSFTNDTHLSGKEFDDYTEMAASLPVTLSGLGWLKFDLTSTVQNWYAARHAPRERLRLLVDCSGCSDMVEAILFQQRPPDADYKPHPETSFSRVINSIDSTSDLYSQSHPSSLGLSNDTQRPFLVVHTDPTAIRRVRRRALDCTDGDKGPCCKNKFYVNFTEIGWEDWIIAPSGYYANYCRGDCGGPHRTPDSYVNFHTPPLEEYRKMDSLPGLQLCCAPLKFSSMSLIYWGLDNKIIKRDLPKMVVDECGCP
ncbi:inhibin beta chain-like [Schistocerca serialis cubense]|uniref:inhibin beta chain-like n=1 Tax=Schistocerca serialis cubense TaxID=2023355 RepID=UPI00214ECA1A|nr:inhibin beta chain-like [Schistocerca serialis cubense]